MLEIKGKVNTAICYAKVIEEDAIEQIRTMCDYELTKDSKIRIMPDVHAGAGCTIGTTMTVIDKACPIQLCQLSVFLLLAAVIGRACSVFKSSNQLSASLCQIGKQP